LQIKKNEVKGHNDKESADEEYQKVAYEHKPLLYSRDFQSLYPEFEHAEMSKLAIKHGDLSIPKKLLVGKELHPLMTLLLLLEKLKTL